jgi:hypothetical protein
MQCAFKLSQAGLLIVTFSCETVAEGYRKERKCKDDASWAVVELSEKNSSAHYVNHLIRLIQ